MGMHDIFEVGIPLHARIINITDPRDRIGTLRALPAGRSRPL